MSLAGARFSSDSALGPFHHGVRERGGTIFGSALPSPDGRSKQTYHLTSSIVPRGTSFHRAVELACSPVRLDRVRFSCCCDLSSPAELGAVNPDAVHDHGQAARQRHDRPFHAAAPGDLIAQMMRAGLYRPVHVKTLRSQKLRMLLTHRSPERPCLHYVVMPSPISLRASARE